MPSPESPATQIPEGPVEKPPPEKPPLSLAEIKEIFADQAATPRFDSSVLGWRIGPYDALVDAGLDDPTLHQPCDPHEAGAETPTELDFTVGYLPSNLKFGRVAGPIKWLCGTDAVSVMYAYNVNTRLGAGQIWITRFIQAARTLEMDVPEDSVEAGSINGKPAIILHPADDETGLGLGRVIVIEDDVEPEFTILRIDADDAVPFAELLKIAEGIK